MKCSKTVTITISNITKEEKLQLEDYIKQLRYQHNPSNYCDIKGCSQEERSSCCGCPEYFEFEKNKKRKKK